VTPGLYVDLEVHITTQQLPTKPFSQIRGIRATRAFENARAQTPLCKIGS